MNKLHLLNLNYTIKFFGFLFVALFVLYANAQPLVSLNNLSSERPKLRDDVSEIGYFGVRCFTNFRVVGGYFVEKGNTPELVSRGKEYMDIADSMLPAILHFESKNGYSQSDTYMRIKKITSQILVDLANNKDLHNNAFHGYIGEDFKFCNDEASVLVEISRMLINQNK
jgi:hypothetical protein